MSLYGVHKVCYLIETDMAFRKGMQDDPAKALQAMPLTDDERRAFIKKDLGALYKMGVHTFLLSRLPRFASMGITRDEYIERMTALTR
jgi:hypothetical protein